MTDLIRKVLDCEIKKLGDRNYEFTASTSTQDRDGEVIDAKGWDLKNFKKNPVIMYAHDYRSLPIGKASRIWLTGGKLKNTVEFPPEGTYEFADIVERLVDTGYLRTESVGFIPKKWEDGNDEKAPKRTYLKQELLEISLVPVPSNPDALRNAVDDGVITTKELETITEPGEVDANKNFFYNTAITKPEETDDWIHIPVRDCKVTATIPISKKEGIQAKYCGKIKKVRTYMFDKRDPYNWTMAKAKAWVKEHDDGKALDEGIEIEEKVVIQAGVEGSVFNLDSTDGDPTITEGSKFEERVATQAEVMDNLDYLKNIIGDVGLNEEATKGAWELVREIMRLAGDDIPDDIRDEIGGPSWELKEIKVKDVIDYLEEYLTKIKEEESDEPEIEPEMDEARIGEIVAKAVGEAIGKAQGKI